MSDPTWGWLQQQFEERGRPAPSFEAWLTELGIANLFLGSRAKMGDPGYVWLIAKHAVETGGVKGKKGTGGFTAWLANAGVLHQFDGTTISSDYIRERDPANPKLWRRVRRAESLERSMETSSSETYERRMVPVSHLT